MDKKTSRLRRARKVRANIRKQGVHRLSVYRTPKHIYAQLFSPDGASVLASASSVGKSFKEATGYGGNIAAATEVGKLIASRAKSAGITRVAFDRSGFQYHGRVKALADAARESGLEF